MYRAWEIRNYPNVLVTDQYAMRHAPAACNKRDLRWRQCQHGGYRDPLDCQRCRCVDGWAGDDRCAKVDTNMTGEWTVRVVLVVHW